MKRILVFLFVALATHTLGQPAPGAGQFPIDKKELKQTIKVLASDSMEGRLTGTAGQNQSDNAAKPGSFDGSGNSPASGGKQKRISRSLSLRLVISSSSK